MQTERLLRLPEVSKIVGYRRSRLYDLMRLGRFPQPVRLPGGRAVAWPESVVRKWVEAVVNGVT